MSELSYKKREFYDTCQPGTIREAVVEMMNGIPALDRLSGDKWYEVEDAIVNLIERNEKAIAQYANKRTERVAVAPDGNSKIYIVGDIVETRDGEKGKITYFSRVAQPGKSGKICVDWLNGGSGEYYDHVFGLNVIELDITEEVKGI